MARKRIFASVLAVLLLLSCCFTVSAADDDTLDLSTFSVLMSREVDNEHGGVTSTAYPCTWSESTIGGVDYLGFYSTSHEFYQSGARKVLLVFQNVPLRAGHEYELEFYTYNIINWGYDVDVALNGTAIDELSVYTHYVSVTEGYGKAYLHSMRFQIPNTEGATNYSLSISYTVPANQYYGSDSSDPLPRFFIQKDPSLVDLDDNTGLLNSIIQWLEDIRDKVLNGFSQLRQSISNLGSTIGIFFTDLKDSLVQKFVDLGNSIGEFFDMLRDYILYFEHPVELDANGVPIGADGQPVYTNPFASKLDEFKTTVNGWLDTINGFINSIDSSRVAVAGYLSNGSTLINGVLTAVPILSVVLTFAIVFLVVRKVVGR